MTYEEARKRAIEQAQGVGVSPEKIDPNYITSMAAGTTQQYSNITPIGTATKTRSSTPKVSLSGFSYSPQYQAQLSDILNQLTSKISSPVDVTQAPEYSALNTLAQQRADLASQQAKEDLNAIMGSLNASATGERIAQVRQQALNEILPSLIQSAYGARQNEISNLSNLLSALQGLEQTGYSQALGTYNVNTQIQQWLAQQQAQERARQEQDAINRVKTLGFVDNASSVILGVPAGTPSAEALQAVLDRASREKIARISNAPQPKQYTPLQEFENAIITKLRTGEALSPQEQSYATSKGWLGPKVSSTPTERRNQAKGDAFAAVRSAIEQGITAEQVKASISAQRGDLAREGLTADDIAEILRYVDDLFEMKKNE